MAVVSVNTHLDSVLTRLVMRLSEHCIHNDYMELIYTRLLSALSCGVRGIWTLDHRLDKPVFYQLNYHSSYSFPLDYFFIITSLTFSNKKILKRSQANAPARPISSRTRAHDAHVHARMCMIYIGICMCVYVYGNNNNTLWFIIIIVQATFKHWTG